MLLRPRADAAKPRVQPLFEDPWVSLAAQLAASSRASISLAEPFTAAACCCSWVASFGGRKAQRSSLARCSLRSRRRRTSSRGSAGGSHAALDSLASILSNAACALTRRLLLSPTGFLWNFSETSASLDTCLVDVHAAGSHESRW